MKKRTVQHKLDLFAALVGMSVAGFAAALFQAQAASTFAVPAGINVVTHGTACARLIPSTGGTYSSFSNGVKNTDTTAALQMICPLTSPPDGFDTDDDFAGVDVADMNNNAGGSVIVKSCYTTRGVTGAGCSPQATTPTTTANGLYGIEIPFPVAVDPTSSRNLTVTLPPQDGAAVSVLRAFGYFDFSATQGGDGGGGGGGGDLTALTAIVNGHTSSISSIYGTLGDFSYNSMTSQFSQHSSQINTLITDVNNQGNDLESMITKVDDHAQTLANHGLALTSLEDDVNLATGDLSTLQSDVMSAQSDITTLQSDMSYATNTAENAQQDATNALSNAAQAQSDVNNVGTTVTSLAGTVTSHTSSINTNASSITSLTSTVNGHTSSINTNASSITSLTGTVSGHTTAITSHDSTLTTHANQLSGITSSGLKSAIESGDSQLDSRVDTLETAVYRRAFVTSTTHNGALGGLSGADGICATRAAAAGLSGSTWKAWLSDGSNSPNTRFTKNNGPYLLLDGTKIANSYTDLTDSNIINAISLDDTGVYRFGSQVWTGTLYNGNINSPNCTGWTIQTAGGQGFRGEVNGTSGTWSTFSSVACDQLARLYCFEQ